MRAGGKGRDRAGCPARRWLVATLIVLAATSASVPAVARAVEGARFTFEVCDPSLPGGGDPSHEFVVNPGVAIGYFDTCAQPRGALGVSEWDHASATFAYLSVAVPATPEGFVETETITATATSLGPGNDHSSVYQEDWPPNNGGENTRTFFLRREPNIFTGNGGGFDLLLNCDANYAPGCEPGPTISAHYIAATEVDLKPPVLAAMEGTLLGGGVLHGHQTLEAKATDVGGGLSKIAVAVNGLPAGEPVAGACGLAQVKNPSYTGTVALSPTPCPTALTGQWTLDTASPPFQNGLNTVQVCAFDFATSGAPNTACSAAVTVDVNNTCTESPVSGGSVLSASFAESNAEAVTVPFGHSAEIAGQLADNAGDPISGATICLQAQTQGTAGEPHPIATATTDAQGQFAYELPPGPDRRLLVGYRHDSFQVGRTISYFAHAQPKLHVRPGRIREGGRVRITGKVPGPSAAGRVVVLQASALHGRRWLTFRRATTGPRGYFASTYRFGSTTHTITYRIRAVVPRQSDYPYDPGHSKPARVKVRANR